MELKLYLFSGAGGTLVLIIILYGMSTIPFSYIVSFLAKTPASGFTMSIIVNILAGCIAPIAAYVLKGNLTFSYIIIRVIDEVSILFCLGLIYFGYIKHPNLVLEFTTFIKSEHKKFFLKFSTDTKSSGGKQE